MRSRYKVPSSLFILVGVLPFHPPRDHVVCFIPLTIKVLFYRGNKVPALPIVPYLAPAKYKDRKCL